VWSKTGLGGTLASDRTSPGPYYCVSVDGVRAVGSGGWESPSGDERAVHGGVLAIQGALNRHRSAELQLTGVFDIATRDAVADYQRAEIPELLPWGGVGSSTAKPLFQMDIHTVCEARDFEEWEVVCGVVQNESAWDPGAVGFVKPVDIGLAQINGEAHPTMNEQQRLEPIFAIDFIISYLTNAMRALSGDVDLAIASYNLGLSGARRWDSMGRPELYTPPGSVTRNVPAYIQRIKTACVQG
jgi:hypothetical protein